MSLFYNLFIRLISRASTGLILIVFLLGFSTLSAQVLPDSSGRDSVPEKKLPNVISKDSLILDSLKRNADLQAPLKYNAEDSIVFDFKTNIMYMYNGAKTDYQGQILESKFIRVELKSNVMHAEGEYINDSLKGSPVFTDKNQVYKAEKITYNFKTRKGKIAYANTKQGTDYIIGDSIKRNPDNTFFVKDGKFTTCDAEHPHFYIHANKLKMIPNDRIVSGPLYVVVADIPIPLIFPFGFFPFNQKRTSGILLPEYGETADRGFFFRNLGYYQAINDYVDATLRADIFTNGSIILRLTPRYMMKYRFNGDLAINYSRETFNEPTDRDFRQQINYNVRWNHNQRITPHTQLTASVNFGSSQFLQRASFNVRDNLQNNLNSNIALTHRFNRAGLLLTATLSQTQTAGAGQTALMTFDLPNLVINKDRFFLLKNKNRVGKERWYEKIGTTYSANLLNRINALPDSLLLTDEFWNRMQNGMRHGVAVNTNFKVLKYINITPALNYNEFWYLETIEKETFTERETVTIINGEEVRTPVLGVRNRKVGGFASARDFSGSMTAATQIFGIFQTGSKRQRAFRHTVNLSGGYSYRPDFSDPSWGFYRQNPLSNPNSTPPQRYSRFEGTVLGGPGAGEQQSLNFNWGNVLEMKYLPNRAERDTTKPKFKNMTLIDNFGMGFSYNLAAEQFRMSNINFSLRNSILNNLVNLNLSGNLDPYKYISVRDTIRRVNELSWQGSGGVLSVPLLTNLSFSAAFTLKSKEQKQKEKKQASENKDKNKNEPPKKLSDKELYEQLYQDFNMPWTLSFSYTGSRTLQPQITRFREDLNQSINISGTVQVTPKWRVNLNTNFSFGSGRPLQLGLTSLGFERDLHCWVLRMDMVPFGAFRRYTLMLNVRAATLQDLRIQKQRNWQDRFGSL